MIFTAEAWRILIVVYCAIASFGIIKTMINSLDYGVTKFSRPTKPKPQTSRFTHEKRSTQ